MALAVAVASRGAHRPEAGCSAIGLVFEMVGSYGIAAARYLDPQQEHGAARRVVGGGVDPAVRDGDPEPAETGAGRGARLGHRGAGRRGLALALQGETTAPGRHSWRSAPRTFVPYLLVALVASIAARVVYRLGTELTHARELGSYRLVERLGQGGMGEVWRAEHQLLARPAAIKLIRLGRRRRPPRRRAARALRARGPSHRRPASPHTIQLYDFGVTDDGTFYYVMELLDGFDLSSSSSASARSPPSAPCTSCFRRATRSAEAHARA